MKVKPIHVLFAFIFVGAFFVLGVYCGRGWADIYVGLSLVTSQVYYWSKKGQPLSFPLCIFGSYFVASGVCKNYFPAYLDRTETTFLVLMVGSLVIDIYRKVRGNT